MHGVLHCLQKGPYFKDLVLNKDLFGILGPYWVLIYISGSLFSLFWLHSRELSHICRHWFRFTLLANFDFYLCLRINFHTSSFWVLILAAGGPYWVLISQKNGSLLGPYLKAWGSLLVLGTVSWLSLSSLLLLLSMSISTMTMFTMGVDHGDMGDRDRRQCVGEIV